jgi:hypothetical protein
MTPNPEYRVQVVEERRSGLTFWQGLFVFIVSGGLIVIGVETGYIPRDYMRYVEKAFDDYNNSFHGARTGIRRPKNDHGELRSEQVILNPLTESPAPR